MQILIVGEGHKRYGELLEELVCEYPELVGYRKDDSPLLMHKILGGADILMMPSRFEPSGNHPLLAMRYGTIPVVRATGALDDAVEPVNMTSGQGTGLKFKDPNPKSRTLHLSSCCTHPLWSWDSCS